MSKLAIIIWIMAAPTLMGIFVLAVLVMPQFADHQAKYIPEAAALGAALAAPLSYVLSGKIAKAMMINNPV